MIQQTNQPFHQKKIPGIFGLAVILIGIAITVYLAGTTTNWFQNAAPSETPNNIRITNVTDTSFTVTYQTDAPYVGTLALDQNNTVQTILDDRDQKSGTPQPYSLHSITTKDLEPNKAYTFSILSGATTFLNNGQKFSITTAQTMQAPPSLQPPLAGKIIGINGTTPQEALVFATSSNGQTISTLIQPSGLYILPLNTLRSKDLSSYLTFTAQSVLQILVVDPTNQAHATILAQQSNPVPAITLGQDYDFTVSTVPVASSSAAGGFPEFSLDTSLKATPQILSPATSDQGYSDAQPLFKGTALPNQDVNISIHSSDVIEKTVTADANGNWSYRPSQPLSPGQHTISITTKTSSGIIQTIQRSFTVYAAGSQVNQTATPSATVVPTTTPTNAPKPTATPTLKPTAAPTLKPTATPTVSGPTYTPTPIPAKPKSLPPTGSNDTIIIGLSGIVTTMVGLFIFFLTKGAVL